MTLSATPEGDASDAEPEADEVPNRRPSRPAVRFVLGLVAGAAALWLVVSTAGGIGDALGAVRRMRLGFVALALVLVALRIGLYGLQVRRLARRSGPLGSGAAAGLSLVVYGVGPLTPTVVVLAIGSRELQRRGRTTRQARLIIGFSEWFAQRSFYAVAAVDLILVIALGHLTLRDSWPFLIAAVVVIVGLGGSAVLARRPASAERVAALLRGIRIHRPQPPSGPERRLAARAWHADAMTVVGPPRNRIWLATVSAAAVLADAATLWATCHAADFHIHPELVLLAATVGTMASWVPLLPGGFGVVEVVIPTILHRFGAPLDGALAATLVYRAAATLLPGLVGGAAIVALRTRHPADAVAPLTGPSPR